MAKASIGSWITLANYSIAEIMAETDFDWLCIDMEHSTIDYSQAQLLIAAVQSKNKPAYVRVGENNPRIIKRVLDAGADGIIVPMVNNLDDAHRAVDAVNYPPVGKRGVGLARAQNYSFGFPEYRDGKAREIDLIVQIEHIDAVENLEDILQLEGVNGTFIGPYDLSGSLGKPGNYDDDDVKEAIRRYEEISRKYDKKMGFHVVVPDHKLLAEKMDAGYNFLAFSLDTYFLGSKIREELNQINR